MFEEISRVFIAICIGVGLAVIICLLVKAMIWAAIKAFESILMVIDLKKLFIKFIVEQAKQKQAPFKPDVSKISFDKPKK